MNLFLIHKTTYLGINKLALVVENKQYEITSISKNDVNHKFILQ